MWPHKHDENGNKLCSYCNKIMSSKRLKYCSEYCADMAAIEANPHSFSYKVIKYKGCCCELCGADKSSTYSNYAALEVHHIIHVKDGGTNELLNLCGLCHDCHVRVHKLCRIVDKILNESQGELPL